MIRFLEKESEQRHQYDAKYRVPIIVLSPSFDGDSGLDFMETGIPSHPPALVRMLTEVLISVDGWLLKPIGFRRLGLIL
jgi:hypothetical protein